MIRRVIANRRARRDRGQPASRQPQNGAARERLILTHGYLAVVLARKFAGRGEPVDDLIQVAYLGLIKAAGRYDPARGTTFSTYAVPTVMGELQRYLRDHACMVHVPRRLLELGRSVIGAAARLAQRLGRTPSIVELAADLGISRETAREACAVGHAYRPVSLDVATPPDLDTRPTYAFARAIAADDLTFERIESRLALHQALAMLPEQLRQLVHLLYYRRLTQKQVARQLKIPQEDVGRLRERALADLRRSLAG